MSNCFYIADIRMSACGQSTGLIGQYAAQRQRDPMTPPREIELKIEVPEEDLVRLTRTPLLRKTRAERRRPASLVSVYYDTATQKLRKNGLTLRVRRIGRRHVQTVKRVSGGSSALMDRCEWEHHIAGREPNLAMAWDTGLKSILNEKLQDRLRPLFETRVRRQVYSIRGAGSEIELSIDKGTVVAGRQSSPICEVELELKRGDAAELFKVARMLAEQVPVKLAVTSKSERGYTLITGEKPRAVGAATNRGRARRELPDSLPDHRTGLSSPDRCESSARARWRFRRCAPGPGGTSAAAGGT